MRPNLKTWQALAIATQFGFTMAAAVGLGFFMGSAIDGWLGTGLVFTLLGALAGMAAAAISTIQLMNFALKRNAAPKTNGEDSSR